MPRATPSKATPARTARAKPAQRATRKHTRPESHRLAITSQVTHRMRRPPRYTAMPAELTAATAAPEQVSVPARAALALDGDGAPGGPELAAAAAALGALGYALRVARAKAGLPSFVLGPIELRWAAAPATGRWHVRLAVPVELGEAELDAAKAAVAARHPEHPLAAAALREAIPPQRLGRILHLGAGADALASLARLDAALEAAGHHLASTYLEVCLTDPRRTPPARMRTALLRELA